MINGEIRPTNLSFADLDSGLRYKLLAGVIVPRPIALVTTLTADGVVNAAPFSFFLMFFSEEPPLVVIGLQSKGDLSPKDTTANVRRSGEFACKLGGRGHCGTNGCVCG